MNDLKIITGQEFYEIKKKLTLVKSLNWENYYLDKETQSKWIEEYPNSEKHGGGSPQLRMLKKFPWES